MKSTNRNLKIFGVPLVILSLLLSIPVTNALSTVYEPKSTDTIDLDSPYVDVSIQFDTESLPLDNASGIPDGRISGVLVKHTSGQPGELPAMYIRTLNSLRYENSPLIIIDGIPGSDLNEIDFREVERIEILKNISETAIYGSQGSNGVVLITTKRGSSGAGKIDFHAQYGFHTLPNQASLLDVNQQMTLFREINSTIPDQSLNVRQYWSNENISGISIDTSDITARNYQNPIYRSANHQSYSLGINGASEKLKFRLSGNYLKKEGVIRKSDYERFLFRLNTDYQMNSRTLVYSDFAMQYGKQNIHDIGVEAEKNNVILASMLHPEIVPQTDEESYFVNPMQSQIDNPEARINGFESMQYKTSFEGVVGIQYNITDKLTYKIEGASDLGMLRAYSYLSRYKTYYGRLYQGIGENALNEYRLWQINTALNYDNKDEINRFSGTLKFLSQHATLKPHIGSSTTYATDYIQLVSAGTMNRKGAGNAYIYDKPSFIGMINYTYDSRYNINASARTEQSPLTSSTGWDYYPALNATWHAKEEAFLNNVGVLSRFDLFAGYGIAGNDGGFWNGYQTPFIPVSITQVFDKNYHENSDLSIEKSSEINAGIMIGLFGNRVDVAVQYFVKNTTDMMVPIYLNDSVVSFQYENLAEVSGKGVEIDLNARIVDKEHLTWDINFNFTELNSEIVSIQPENNEKLSEAFPYYKFEDGSPLFAFYGYKTDGIFQNQSEIDAHPFQSAETAPGDIRFMNKDNNDVIDENDQYILGSPVPDFYFGISGTVFYRGFGLSYLFNGAFGHEILNLTRTETEGMYDWLNQSESVTERWQQENDQTDMPRAVYGDPNGNTRVSDRFIEDGSYIKLKSLSLSYNLPASWCAKYDINSLKIYVSGYNLFTITDYSGFDPEINTFQGLGIDYGGYPLPRIFSLGLTLGL